MDLTGLLSDAEYEVRIRAMNKQGWSQLSQPSFNLQVNKDRANYPNLLKTFR